MRGDGDNGSLESLIKQNKDQENQEIKKIRET